MLIMKGSVQTLKITTVAENSAMSALLGQWGLSFLVEIIDGSGHKRKVLMDTGLDKRALLHNVKKLEIDLSDVDCIVLSHGHLDHTATTVEAVKATGGVKVYANPHTFLHRFHRDKKKKERDIGVPKGEGIAEIEKAGGKVVLTSKPTEIFPGLWTTGQIERSSFESVMQLSEGERLIIVVDGKETDDRILDDQALWTHVEGTGTYVITGCAHSGPINTLNHVQKVGQMRKLHGLIGGTHLAHRSEKYIQQTIAELRPFDLKLISPCHCTGFKATADLWNAFPNSFVLNFSGRTIEAGKEPRPRVF
jgi:7,8-dihydropterin-6-yl-methyl-4-(beta-D-ribofuranosyl)aminobenzene 5'-phosphate synthase